MTDIQLYTKISELSPDMKNQISNYIDHLKKKSNDKTKQGSKRISGMAKGLVRMKDDFDEPF